jgi:starch phosphorylase
MVRHTRKSLGPKVLATRMVRDYVRELHAPAVGNARMLNADYAGAAKLAAWKKRVTTGWPSVRVERVESSGVGEAAEVGALLSVPAFVSPGELTPDDVHVQVLHGNIDTKDVLTDVTVQDLDLAESYDGGRYRFNGPSSSTAAARSARQCG